MTLKVREADRQLYRLCCSAQDTRCPPTSGSWTRSLCINHKSLDAFSSKAAVSGKNIAWKSMWDGGVPFTKASAGDLKTGCGYTTLGKWGERTSINDYISCGCEEGCWFMAWGNQDEFRAKLFSCRGPKQFFSLCRRKMAYTGIRVEVQSHWGHGLDISKKGTSDKFIPW